MAVIMDKRFGYQASEPSAETPLVGAIIGMPNEIEEHLAKIDLPSKVSRFLSYFRRASWGWAGAYQARGYERPGTWCDYDAKECQEMTGLTPDQSEQARRWLVDARIVTYEIGGHRRGQGRLIWNLVFSEWKPLQLATPRWGGARKGAGRTKKQRPEEIKMNPTASPPLDTRFILISEQDGTGVSASSQENAPNSARNQDESESFQDESESFQDESESFQDESWETRGASPGAGPGGSVIMGIMNNGNNADANASGASLMASPTQTQAPSSDSHFPETQTPGAAFPEGLSESQPPSQSTPIQRPLLHFGKPVASAPKAPKKAPIATKAQMDALWEAWEAHAGVARRADMGKQEFPRFSACMARMVASGVTSEELPRLIDACIRKNAWKAGFIPRPCDVEGDLSTLRPLARGEGPQPVGQHYPTKGTRYERHDGTWTGDHGRDAALVIKC